MHSYAHVEWQCASAQIMTVNMCFITPDTAVLSPLEIKPHEGAVTQVHVFFKAVRYMDLMRKCSVRAQPGARRGNASLRVEDLYDIS